MWHEARNVIKDSRGTVIIKMQDKREHAPCSQEHWQLWSYYKWRLSGYRGGKQMSVWWRHEVNFKELCFGLSTKFIFTSLSSHTWFLSMALLREIINVHILISVLVVLCDSYLTCEGIHNVKQGQKTECYWGSQRLLFK